MIFGQILGEWKKIEEIITTERKKCLGCLCCCYACCCCYCYSTAHFYHRFEYNVAFRSHEQERGRERVKKGARKIYNHPM